MDLIDIGLVSPSNDNPRLNSNKEVIESLVNVFKERGWETVSPIAVRKVENHFEIVDGHHRYEAAKIAKLDQLLGIIYEFNDRDAVFQRWLMNHQSEFTDVEKCLYFYRHTKKDSKKGFSRTEFARRLGVSKDTGKRWADAGEILEQYLNAATLLNGKTLALALIHKTPQQYWELLINLMVSKCWSYRETEKVVNAIKDFDIPTYFQHWLIPEVWLKKIIAGDEEPEDINKWMTTAQREFDLLDSERKVVLIRDGKEVIEYWDLKQRFLERLPETCYLPKKPSGIKIESLAADILREVKQVDLLYEKWKISRASEQEQKKRNEEERLQIQELKLKYHPRGFNKDILDFFNTEELLLFNAIITDPPYLLSNITKNFDDTLEPEKYVSHFFDVLRDGGYFVFTATHHIRFKIHNAAEQAGFKLVQDLIWSKKKAPAVLTADRFRHNFEYIGVYKKAGKSYFGYEDVKENGSDIQRSSILEIEPCSGNERQGWHDTQKPLELMELLIKAYVPVNGLVLDPFAGSGTTAVAAKKLNRICYWVEKEVEFYKKASIRIEETKFSWEI